MRRGFKAFAERQADQLRAELSFGQYERLLPRRVAEHFDIAVWYPEDLDLSPGDIDQLTKHDADSWSGVTVKEAGLTAIILNSAHKKTREAHTLMHELSHVILKHAPNRVDIADSGMLLLSDFSKEHEEEADWLSGCLLLPRPLLLRLRSAGKGIADIAKEHQVSNHLCQWRIRMTGIEYQLGNKRRPTVTSN